MPRQRERDERPRVPIRRAKVRDVFTEGLRSIPASSSVGALASLLYREGIQGVAVTDDLGCVIGVVSQADLTRDASWNFSVGPDHPDDDDIWPETRVADLMSHDVLSIDVDTPLAQAARRMMAEGVRRLLVRREGGYVGMLTAGDLMRAWVLGTEAQRDQEAQSVQARLERHLRSVEGLPGGMARQIARRRSQAWSQRLRLREQRGRELLRRLDEAFGGGEVA
jgi:CBS domain-containing protein